MNTATVKSTVIDTVSYDQDTKTIQVLFKNGAIYEYAARPDVDPPDDMKVIYISFINATSAGEFFARRIRNVLPFRRVEIEPREVKTIMATKDRELIMEIDQEVRAVDGALIQIRNVTKALEGARDTLRYVRNVMMQRDPEPANGKH